MQMQITDNGRSNRMLHINCARELHVNQDSHTECYMLAMHESHALIKICSYLTQFLKENHQNST